MNASPSPSRAEWPAALAEAARYEIPRVRYLMRQPLGDLIEEGLAELGCSLEELSGYGH